MATDTTEMLKAVLDKLVSIGAIYPSNFIGLPNLERRGWKAHERGAVKQAVYEGVRKGLIIWINKSKKLLAVPKSRLREIKLSLYGRG